MMSFNILVILCLIIKKIFIKLDELFFVPRRFAKLSAPKEFATLNGKDSFPHQSGICLQSVKKRLGT